MTHSFNNSLIKLSVITSIILCLMFCLCGCASENKQEPLKENEATEVYNNFVEQTHDHMQIDGHLILGMNILGYNLSFPINISGHIANESNYLDLSTSVLHLNIENESYLVPENDKYAIYNVSELTNTLIASNNPRAWIRCVTDVPAIDVSNLLTIDSSFLANANCEIADNTYEISIPITQTIDSLQNAVGTTGGYIGSLFDSLRATGAKFEEISVKYVFDEDCNLRHIYVPETIIPLDNGSGESNFNIALDITINYDENVDITIPDEAYNNVIDISPSELGNTANTFLEEIKTAVNDLTHGAVF